MCCPHTIPRRSCAWIRWLEAYPILWIGARASSGQGTNHDTILDDETLTVVNITIITVEPTYTNQISFKSPQIRTMKIVFTTLISIALLSTNVIAGIVAWGFCQSACNAGYGVCCTAAGAVADTSNSDTPVRISCTSIRLSSIHRLLADANRNLHRRRRYPPCPSWMFGYSGHLYGRLHPTLGRPLPVK